MRPAVVIGDIHGLDSWKWIVDSHPECEMVFLGDYLDPKERVPKVELLRNLEEIVALKRSRPEDVVLLLGNHDLHYFCEEAPLGSRFNADMAEDASRLFSEFFRTQTLSEAMKACGVACSIVDWMPLEWKFDNTFYIQFILILTAEPYQDTTAEIGSPMSISPGMIRCSVPPAHNRLTEL